MRFQVAAVAPKGIATPILAGGPQAADAAELLNPFGMSIKPGTWKNRNSSRRLTIRTAIPFLAAIW